MWIRAIFAREFGYSDVQANYSRVYAWMANQLGHMTLGLATAFLYFWIADTIGATARLVLDWSGRPQQSGGECELAAACIANNYLLIFASLVILGVMAAAFAIGAFGPALEVSQDVAARYRAIAIRARRAIHAVLFCLAVIALTYLAIRADNAPDPETAERIVGAIGVTVASFAIGAGVALICQDIRYFTCALLALFGAFWIATSGAGAGPVAHRWVAVSIALLFWLYALNSTALSRSLPEGLGFKERFVQACVVTGLAIWFVFGTWNGLEGDWPLAIAASLASVTLWWVKEFGSDLPNVHKEVAEAVARRPKTVLGRSMRVQKEYLDDARMDARTDGMFYLAGAWVGAGVLSTTPVMTDTSWESGSEILGLLVFLAVFLWMGKGWAFRQQALDFAGLNMASRLAVYRSALKIAILPQEEDGREPLPYLAEPLDALRDYAREIDFAGFNHLAIFGARGSGRSPLGRAIASEAALADFPIFEKRPGGGDREPRAACYISAGRLALFMRDVDDKSDLMTTPPLDLAIDMKTGAVTRWTDETSEKTHRRHDAATTAVIDDVDISRPGVLDGLTANLALAKGQKTVWLLEDDRFDPTDGYSTQSDIDAWEPDYRIVRAELSALRAALTVAGQPAPRIAVGFTRRFSSPAQR